jgi:3-isopropylmalate/(R)-2-methylmalate dehydratase small subunit
MKTFGGPVLFLDRSDINTDEIIPAKYLTEVDKAALKPFLLEDLELAGFERDSQAFANARVIVTKRNFGCGSSREHAPWALEVNDITIVIAESFARIFRQNMFNGGLLAIELPPKDISGLFSFGTGGAIRCAVDLDKHILTFVRADGKEIKVAFSVAPFDEALVKAGGWVEFADAKY